MLSCGGTALIGRSCELWQIQCFFKKLDPPGKTPILLLFAVFRFFELVGIASNYGIPMPQGQREHQPTNPKNRPPPPPPLDKPAGGCSTTPDGRCNAATAIPNTASASSFVADSSHFFLPKSFSPSSLALEVLGRVCRSPPPCPALEAVGRGRRSPRASPSSLCR